MVLYDPKDKDISERFRADSIRAELSLRGLLTGNPRVREINIVRPIVNLPMARERSRQLTATVKSSASLDQVPLAIDRVVVSDATAVFKDPRRGIENKIDKINVKAIATPGRKLDVTVDARSDGQIFKLEVKATVPTGPVDGLTLPVEFKLDAPGMLPQAISGNCEVKLSGTTVTINTLSGMLGTARFQRLRIDRDNDQAAGQGQSRFQATRHRCARRRQFEIVATVGRLERGRHQARRTELCRCRIFRFLPRR